MLRRKVKKPHLFLKEDSLYCHEQGKIISTIMYSAISSHLCVHLACSGKEHLLPLGEGRRGCSEPVLERAEHRRDEGGRMLTAPVLTL